MTIATHLMVDTIGANALRLPPATTVAGYVTGTGVVPWSDSTWAHFTGVKVRINQANGSNPLLGDVLDVENGCWSNSDAARAAKTRQDAKVQVSLYTSRSNVSALVNACEAAGVTGGHLWVADWSMSEVKAQQEVEAASGPWPVVAVQYASPSSNPNTNVPGTGKTLGEMNVDLSVKNAAWLAPAPVAPPVVTPPVVSPKVTDGMLVTADLSARKVTSPDGKNWTLA